MPLPIRLLLTFTFVIPMFAIKPSVHRALAFEAARRAGFSETAVRIIAVGAAAPDLYDWETAAAHGQTPNNNNGYPTRSQDEATADFYRYVQEKSAQIDASLSAGNLAEALYRVGYTMHAFQDLSAHMGITNYAHSQLAKDGHDPDLDPDRVARAAMWSNDVLQRSADRWGTEWDRLKKYQGAGPNDFDKLATTISSGEADRTWESLVSYWWSRFSKNALPSGGWGGLSQIEAVRAATLDRINTSGSVRSVVDAEKAPAKCVDKRVVESQLQQRGACVEACVDRYGLFGAMQCCPSCDAFMPYWMRPGSKFYGQAPPYCASSK